MNSLEGSLLQICGDVLLMHVFFLLLLLLLYIYIFFFLLFQSLTNWDDYDGRCDNSCQKPPAWSQGVKGIYVLRMNMKGIINMCNKL